MDGVEAAWGFLEADSTYRSEQSRAEQSRPPSSRPELSRAI